MVGKVLENKSEKFGFDAQTEQYVDLIDKGIVDPAKVVRAALQDAASVAGLLGDNRGDGGGAAEEVCITVRRCPAAAAWAGWITEA